MDCHMASEYLELGGAEKGNLIKFSFGFLERESDSKRSIWIVIWPRNIFLNTGKELTRINL